MLDRPGGTSEPHSIPEARLTDSDSAGAAEPRSRTEAEAPAERENKKPEADRASPQPQAPAVDEPRTDVEQQPRKADGEEQPQKPAAELTPEGVAKSRRPLWRRPLVWLIAAIGVIVAVPAGYLYMDNSSHFESTDDAFVAARQFSIAPQVSGYVTAVPVTDNQHVDSGGIIARIDSRNYEVALEQAEAQVAAAQADIANRDAQITVQEAQIASNQAQVNQAEASLVFAKEQAARFQALVKTGSGTVENAQQYASQQNQQEAALASAKATLALAERQIDTLKAQRASSVANLKTAQAQRDQAELNLTYTVVTAAQPGRVASLTAGVGEYATVGAALTTFVPDDIWVTANFKETELDKMRPGQPVTMKIDAYPERDFQGRVASIQPGSGTAFSLLPAENATGNYVKVVQRVPVKIVFEQIPKDVTLGPGMSIVPTVRVDPAPSHWENLEAGFPWLKRLPLIGG